MIYICIYTNAAAYITCNENMTKSVPSRTSLRAHACYDHATFYLSVILWQILHKMNSLSVQASKKIIIQRCRCFAHAETSGIHKIRSFQALKDVAALHMQRHQANVHKIRSFQALKDVAALHMQRHLANVHKIRSFQALKDVAALHMQRPLANVHKIRSFQALKDVAALHMQRHLANDLQNSILPSIEGCRCCFANAATPGKRPQNL